MKSVKKISVQTVSNVNSDKLAIELWGDDDMMGDVVIEGDKRKLHLYSQPDAKTLDLDELIAALETAKRLNI